MKFIALYLGILALGYFAGSRIRKEEKPTWPSKIIQASVLFLVFTMGMRIGLDEKVIQGLGVLGLKATVLTIAAISGSILFVFLLRKLLKVNNEGV